MAHNPTIKTEKLIEFIAELRQSLPTWRLSLGCARRRPDHNLEAQAIQAGINAIALPEEQTLRYAENAGLMIRHHKVCCSVSFA